MADETPRLGLPIYTSGTDLHPTREDFNDRMGLLEEAVAIARQGTRDDRPLPSTRGTLFMETDTRLLWFDTGTEWIRVVRVGNDGPGRDLNIGGEGAEGESEWAARADHTHPLPLASGSQPGAMSAADKAKLDAASDNANAPGGSLVSRGSHGNVSTPAPTGASHAVNLTYFNTNAVRDHGRLDNSVHLDNVREPGDYAQNAAFLGGTNGYPEGFSGGTLAIRQFTTNTNSVIQVLTSWSPLRQWIRSSHASGTWRNWERVALTGDPTPASGITGTLNPARLPAASRAAQGAISAADKTKLDDATSVGSADRLVIRDAAGRARVADPDSVADIANKRYVDDRTDGSALHPVNVETRNLNDVRAPGMYYQSGSNNATSARNYPAEDGGGLVVTDLGANWKMQEYTVRGDLVTYRRRYNGASGTWGSWSQVGG